MLARPQGFALSALVFVMRENVVHTAGVNIDLRAQLAIASK